MSKLSRSELILCLRDLTRSIRTANTASKITAKGKTVPVTVTIEEVRIGGTHFDTKKGNKYYEEKMPNLKTFGPIPKS